MNTNPSIAFAGSIPSKGRPPSGGKAETKTGPSLRERLVSRRGMLRLIGVHDVMGAWLAERAGFDGIWASSLEITTVAGRLDDGWDAAGMVLEISASIARAARLPLVADCQVDSQDPDGVRARVGALAAAGVAGVCLQDSLFPCPNSLLPGEHPLAPMEDFAEAVRAARSVAPAGMAVIARVQAFVAGTGQEDAIDRSLAYVSAGADAIVIHSRKPDPAEVLGFITAWDDRAPLVLIPSTYPQLTADLAAQTKKVGMMIHANHGLRASLAAMERVFREILKNGGSLPSEEWIASLDEVFLLQHDPRTRRP